MTEYYYRFRDGSDLNEIYLEAFPVIRRTPAGVWIDAPGYANGRFILNNAYRRWAYPTKELALASYRKRKESQIAHGQASVDRGKSMLDFLDEQQFDLREGYGPGGEIWRRWPPRNVFKLPKGPLG